jgi:hypothetical protein
MEPITEVLRMNIFTSIGIIFLLLSALRLAYHLLVAINPNFVVLSMHRAVALLPGSLSIRVRKAWWDYLTKNCSHERPCIECAREQQAQRRAEGA